MLDIKIREAVIVDGSGAPGRVGDVGISGDRIAGEGEVSGTARREIDARGLTVTPGFIDIHTHSDFSLLLDGRAESARYQGVTTQVNGNCGISAFPVGPDGVYLGAFESVRLRESIRPDWVSAEGYFAALETRGVGINTAFFTGHGAVRQAVMGQSVATPTRSEMEAMKAWVARSMEEGSLGLSTGLTYVPGSAARTEEIAELAAATAPFSGIYATHMRNYTASIMDAVEESIAIGRAAGVPVHLSHVTPCPPSTGRAGEILDRLERAAAEGMDVTAETEFYATGSTSMKSLLPPWALVGGNAALVDRLGKPDLRERMWREIRQKGSELGGSTKTVLMQYGQWEKLWLGNCTVNRGLTGKTFEEIGRLRGRSPFEAICDILVEEKGAVSFYGEDKSNEDIDSLAGGRLCGIGSDGLALATDGPLAGEREHPRCYGGMAYLIRTMVRERRALSLEKLVEKITAFPARRMRLKDRGLLREGMFADLAIFDAERITDRATITDPCRYSEGMRWLFVNGVEVLADGRTTAARAGRVLRREPA
jgi:N-acyl-D-aspartate/D-glutamate deacylase